MVDLGEGIGMNRKHIYLTLWDFSMEDIEESSHLNVTVVGLIQLQQRPTFLKTNSLTEYTGSLLSDKDSLASELFPSHRESLF